MSRRTIQMHEYRQALILMRKGKSNREIAKLGILSRIKAKQFRELASSKKWLIDSTMPSDSEIQNVVFCNDNSHSKVLPFKSQLEEWFSQGISAVVAHRTLKEKFAFSGSYNSVQRYMKLLKNDPEKNATIILKFNPGEYAQVDFGKGPIIFDKDLDKNISSWFFVMTLCWSRHQYAEIVSNQKIDTWLGCHKRAFEWFGGIVEAVIIDNAACAIAKASYTEPSATKSYASFAEDCEFIISPCPPYDPEKKGIVESGVKYIKRNFMPLKKFDSLLDANNQLKDWILNVAGKRIHGTTKKQPLELFNSEKILLKELPNKIPEFYIWKKLLANRNCHVRYNQCQYSFPYKLIGKKLWVKHSETTVKIYDDDILVAIHPRRTKAGEISTILEHLPPKAKAYLQHDKNWCLTKSKVIGKYCYELVSTLLDEKPVDMLRAAQSIVYLKDKYGDILLDDACKRALDYGTPRYRVVKKILKRSLITEETSSAPLADIYKGNSEFCREIESIYH